MMNRILILFFHPRYEESRANKALVEAARKTEGVTFRDMYELYPDFNIRVEDEKKLMQDHEVIIWQHPLYWYNCPPLMKQWMDLVLEYGWAYGRGGDALKDKWIMNVITSGGTFEVYQKNGRNRFTYRELMASFDQTAHLCQMHYLPPFVLPGANRVKDEELKPVVDSYISILHFLGSGKADVYRLKKLEYFNDLKETSWEVPYFITH